MLTEKKPLVYIIVLNYNGYKDTIECIQSIENITYKNYKIILVDNCSTDASEDILRERFSEYTFIQTGSNLGYAGGNNVGIEYALKDSADYICVLNNDVIVDKDFLGTLVEIMESNLSIGIIGPKICEYYDRSLIQSTGSRINLYTGSVPAINAGQNKDCFKHTIEVDYMGGACLLVRRKLIEKIGTIPELYFLFFEETEWCMKAKRNKYKILCTGEAEVYHKGSSAVSKVKGIQEYYMTRNNIIFEKRNANWFQYLVFITLKTLRIGLSLAKGLVKRNINGNLMNGYKDGLKYKIR